MHLGDIMQSGLDHTGDCCLAGNNDEGNDSPQTGLINRLTCNQ
jgi:hypothetical protein